MHFLLRVQPRVQRSLCIARHLCDIIFFKCCCMCMFMCTLPIFLHLFCLLFGISKRSKNEDKGDAWIHSFSLWFERNVLSYSCHTRTLPFCCACSVVCVQCSNCATTFSSHAACMSICIECICGWQSWIDRFMNSFRFVDSFSFHRCGTLAHILYAMRAA